MSHTDALDHADRTKALAVGDAYAQSIDQVYCCEDSYTQERKIVVKVFDSVESDQLWIAERNFCTSMFLTQVHISKSLFLVRRHHKNVRFHETGEAREIGKTERNAYDECNHFACSVCKMRIDALGSALTCVIDLLQ